MALPKVLLCRGDLPTKILQEAHDAGKIELIKRDDSDKEKSLKEWTLSYIENVDAIVVTFALPCNAEILNAGKKLKVIATMSVGTDHIDMQLCKEKGIPVLTTINSLDETVAETTLMLTLGITRCVPIASRVVREGKWSTYPWTPLTFAGMSLQDKTIGFLGFGNIAQACIPYFAPFKPKKIIYKTSKPKSFDLNNEYFAKLKQTGFKNGDLQIENEPDTIKLAKQSDVIIILMNLSPSSKHLVNENFLSNMKSTAYLINVARGGIVDTKALVNALKNNQIAGAGIDAIENEPNIPQDHELLQPDCRDKVFMLPHIGSATVETRRRMADVIAEQLLSKLL